jgi:hypothetical protein
VLAEALLVDASALTGLGRQSEASATLRQAAELTADHRMPHAAAAAQAALSMLS